MEGMNINLEQVVIIGAIIALLIDRVLLALKERGIDLQKMAKQTENIYEMHKALGPNGIPRLYVRESLYKDVEFLKEKINDIENELLIMKTLMGERLKEIRDETRGRKDKT